MASISENRAIVTRPLEDQELPGAAVMACSVLSLEELVEEFKQERLALARLVCSQVDILKAFGDLYLELTDETERRKFLSRSILRAEREAARLRLPTWFWRPEADADLNTMLLRRAWYLMNEHVVEVNIDDLWDLLKEFAEEYAREPVPDEQLMEIIERAKTNSQEEPSNACAS